MGTKGENKYVIVATANKLTSIFYRMASEEAESSPADLDDYRK